MALTTAQPSRARQPPPTGRGGTSRIAGVYLLALAAALALCMGPAQLPSSLHNFGSGPGVAGAVIAGSTVTGTLGTPAFPQLRRRPATTAITTVSITLLGAGRLPAGTGGMVVRVLGGMLVGGTGTVLVAPDLSLLLSELAPDGPRGRVLSGLVTAASSDSPSRPWPSDASSAGPASQPPSPGREGRRLPTRPGPGRPPRRPDAPGPTRPRQTPPHTDHISHRNERRKGSTPMIHHCVRFTIKPGTTPTQLEDALASLRNQGEVIPSVHSFLVGRDHGGEYEWGATFQIADLEGYWEYLIHPAHRRTDEIGLPLVDKFVSFDITDDPDPAYGDQIAALHRRRFDADPGLTELVSNLNRYEGSAAPGRHAV